MERLRHRVREERLPAPPPEVEPSSAPLPDTPPPPPPPIVQVIWGPVVETMALVGMTVAEARALLRSPFNIAPQAAALIDGRAVGAEHRLTAGEVLEFRREFGEKGVRP